jgi:cell fate regulator YaaT (PSP1 superfamily)
VQQDRPEKQESGPRVSVVDVKFRTAGKIYQYDAGSLPLQPGDRVVVQGEGGTNLGTVAASLRMVPAQAIKPKALPRVVKNADPRDIAREEANLRRGNEAQRLCVRFIRERNLPMKVVKAECLFDGSKIIMYFFAEDRVDFRELVRDLAQALHTRIEMKQIGPRDETKVVGGVGPCGLETCCASWLRDFSAVSVKMAKEQGISLNPTKLAGMCRRLKCCLRYEYENYRKAGRKLPVETPVERVETDTTTHFDSVASKPDDQSEEKEPQAEPDLGEINSGKAD